MTSSNRDSPWRVLIASSHPLFAKGLLSLLQKQRQADVMLVGMVSTIEEALKALSTLHPDLIIVDYDDEKVNRDEFLARFVEGEGRLRVVLLSLKEGGDEAIVYDRRTMAASQIDDWLENWSATAALEDSAKQSTRMDDSKRTYPKRSENMRHIIGAILVVAIILGIGFFILNRANLLPEQASVQAGKIDGLFNLHFQLIVILFAIVVGVMVYSIVGFRRKSGDYSDAVHIEGNTSLEALWTIIPLGIVIYISYLGAIILGDVERRDPRPVEVDVIASQWSWRFEYPDYGIISTELILPENKQALLHLSSTDIIHSFWVPEFRVKQDALPGGIEMVRQLRVTPTQRGEYKVLCAELCGLGHADMRAPVSVVSQAEFDAWIQAQTEPISDDPVERGAIWAQQFGCIACHSVDGTPGVGPTWLGLYGEEVELEDGSMVVADEAYLYEAIRDPGATIVAGFLNLMPPNIADNMSDEQIDDVIAYIASLRE